MNKFSWITFLLTTLFISNFVGAQHANLSTSQIEQYKSRTLVVELLEKEQDSRGSMIKKYGENSNVVLAYDRFINDYNIYIKEYVDKYWKLNSTIEYKTTSAIKNIDSKEKYAVLKFAQAVGTGSKIGDIKKKRIFGDRLFAPLLIYRGLEKGGELAGNRLYFPMFKTGYMTTVKPSYVALTVRLFQKSLEKSVELGKKKFHIRAYSKYSKNLSCAKLKNRNMIIEVNSVGSLSEEDAKNTVGSSVNFVIFDEVEEAILNEDNTKVISLIIPSGFFNTGTKLYLEDVAFFKVSIAPDSLEIFGYADYSPSAGRGKVFEKNDLKKVAKCD